MDYTVLGKNIRNERKEQKYTQAELAELVDISTVFLSQLENGTKKPSFETIYKIAIQLNTTIDNLIMSPKNQSMSNIRINTLLNGRTEKEQDFIYKTVKHILSMIDDEKIEP